MKKCVNLAILICALIMFFAANVFADSSDWTAVQRTESSYDKYDPQMVLDTENHYCPVIS